MSNRRRRKNKSSRFITLNLKLATVVVVALIMTFIVFEVLTWVQSLIAQNNYLSEKAIEQNVNEVYDNLNEYIASNKIKSTDTDLLQQWVKDNEYVYLMVSDNFSISFEGGWRVGSGTATEDDITEDQTNINYDNEDARITLDTFTQDTKNRVIRFEDGLQYVYINVYKEEAFYRRMMFVKIIACVVTLIGIILVYNTLTIKRISRLSVEVNEVTKGNLTADIAGTANDEIGRLADNVNSMRDYIIRRLQSEKEAWDKNSELITAMSHDIRTPLTSLIGYLDIIESEKYESKEDEKRYIEASKEKALQLKDLSDKLFQYFLVFGSQPKEKEIEVYDAEILLQQIISEHSAELMSYGFKIDLEYTLTEETEIKVDISGLRRLFDNLFSNLTKYADKSSPIRISVTHDPDDKFIIVRMMNGVLTESRKVESNKIGLKTCDKICSDMGGEFTYSDEGQIFTVKLTLPIFVDTTREDVSPLDMPGEIDIHDINIHNVEEILGEDLSNIEVKDNSTDEE